MARDLRIVPVSTLDALAVAGADGQARGRGVDRRPARRSVRGAVRARRPDRRDRAQRPDARAHPRCLGARAARAARSASSATARSDMPRSCRRGSARDTAIVAPPPLAPVIGRIAAASADRAQLAACRRADLRAPPGRRARARPVDGLRPAHDRRHQHRADHQGGGSRRRRRGRGGVVHQPLDPRDARARAARTRAWRGSTCCEARAEASPRSARAGSSSTSCTSTRSRSIRRAAAAASARRLMIELMRLAAAEGMRRDPAGGQAVQRAGAAPLPPAGLCRRRHPPQLLHAPGGGRARADEAAPPGNTGPGLKNQAAGGLASAPRLPC